VPLAFSAGTGKPDLRVTELTLTQVATTSVPLRIKVRVAIKNYGESTGAARSVTRLSFRKTSSAPWQKLNEWAAGAVARNGGANYEKTFDFQEGRLYFFLAEVDAAKSVSETSETNNTRTTSRSFNAGTPDLTVQNLAATLNSVSSTGTWSVKVEWDVKNAGDGKAAGSFVTVLSVSKNGGGYSEVQRYTRSNLDAGRSTHISRTGSYSDLTSLKFKVEADATHGIHERAEGNNIAYSETLRR
jgi:hypothetical protein